MTHKEQAERRQRMVAAVASGKTVKQVCVAEKVSVSTIRKALVEAGYRNCWIKVDDMPLAILVAALKPLMENGKDFKHYEYLRSAYDTAVASMRG